MTALSRMLAAFALLALVPAALAPTAALAAGNLRVTLCDGTGNPPSLVIPVHRSPFRGGEDSCCVKGCHAGGTRKKFARGGQFDPKQ